MKTVVAALIEKDGRFFLAKRSTGNKEVFGAWEFPGWKVEDGESDEAALERENTRGIQYGSIYWKEDCRNNNRRRANGNQRENRGSKQVKANCRKFLAPLNSLDLQMRAADMLQMNLLARKIFLNLEIDQQKRSFTDIKNRFKRWIRA